MLQHGSSRQGSRICNQVPARLLLSAQDCSRGSRTAISLHSSPVCLYRHRVTESLPDLLPQAFGLSEVLGLSCKGLGLRRGSCRQMQMCSMHSNWWGLKQIPPPETIEAEGSGCGPADAGIKPQVRSHQCTQNP